MDTLTQELELRRYAPASAREWDEFAAASRNATFLHRRAYMDYHADRFRDCSLMAYRRGKLCALLPACLLPDGTLSSHAGLTYGGWLLPPSHLDGAMLLSLMELWVDWCQSEGVRAIDYKPLPYIYAAAPSQEELYALWRLGFTQSAALLSAAVDLRYPWKFDMSKRQQARRAIKQGAVIVESDDYAPFWALLEACLGERHDAAPVHTLGEIERLHRAFPQNIRLFTLSEGGALQTGVCIYDTGLVAHSQYAATTAAARRAGSLAALYNHLMTEVFASRRYFDFGTSNEQGGRVLNAGLLTQKYSMGATGVLYPRYSLSL